VGKSCLIIKSFVEKICGKERFLGKSSEKRNVSGK
jgi:hypothetical protein